MSRIKPLYNGAKLVLTITSDNHIDRKNPTPFVPMGLTRASLIDSGRSVRKVDAYITVGDTTSRGDETNWRMAVLTFKGAHPAEHVYLTVGNHDLWYDDKGYDAAFSNYVEYSNRICGTSHEKTWFSHELNGYKLIFLGNTRDAGCEAHLGQDQIDWLKKELDEADGAPAFVFCHQSLNGRHGLPMTWNKSGESTDPLEGGIGEESDAVAEILKAHKNVFYFSGHSHMGLGGENCLKNEGYASIEDEDGVTLINLPSLACGNHHGENRSLGVGVVVEAYLDRVVIRPRNFLTRSWIKSVAMKDGKPYYEVRRQ